MTLQQAHEIQRRELISLRAENKKLKSGSFTNDEKLALEKEIRKLNSTVNELVKTVSRYKNLLENARRQNDCLSNIVYGDILSNPDYYLTGRIISKQVCDIEVSVSVTEYSTPEYRIT